MPRPVICCAPKCTTRKGTSEVETYFFPTSAIQKNRWLIGIKSQGWKPSPFSFVCALHFSEDSFEPDGSLKTSAVPSLKSASKSSGRKLPRRVTVSETTPASQVLVEQDHCYIQPEKETQSDALPALPESSQSDKIKELEDRIKFLEARNSYLEELRAAVLKIFNEDQLDKLAGFKQKPRWSDDTYEKSLHTYYVCGITGYSHLRDIGYPLPSLTTLREKIAFLDFRPGHFNDSFNLLKLKAERMSPGTSKDCALVFDELAIDPRIEYDVKYKTLSGFCSIPRNSNGVTKKAKKGIPAGKFDDLATHAQIWLLAGLGERWKHIVGHDLTGDSFDCIVAKQRIEGIVRKSKSMGVKVRACVADNGSCNQGV